MTVVFVPLIGFRSARTRTLRERVETTEGGTGLVVHSIAAAPDRTDVVVEWQRIGDPAVCPPDSKVLVHSNRQPLDNGLAAEIATGATSVQAASMFRRSYHMSLAAIGAIDALRFPALPANVDHAELRLREGTTEWRLPLFLQPGGVEARTVDAQLRRDGVTIRATAVCTFEDQLIVELEVEAPTQIRQVAGPIPSPQRYLDTSSEDHAARTAEMQRVFGDRAQPITLADDHGIQIVESRRLFSHDPQQAAPGTSFVSRFCVMFDVPAAGSAGTALVVPFVELNDLGPSATVDLRHLPKDVELSQYRFRVAAIDPGPDQTKIRLELAPSPAAPRFMQPARVHGSGPEFGWQRQSVGPSSDGREIWMATKVGDPPIVTFTGVVLRVDGPLRVDLPL